MLTKKRNNHSFSYILKSFKVHITETAKIKISSIFSSPTLCNRRPVFDCENLVLLLHLANSSDLSLYIFSAPLYMKVFDTCLKIAIPNYCQSRKVVQVVYKLGEVLIQALQYFPVIQLGTLDHYNQHHERFGKILFCLFFENLQIIN